MFPQTELSKRGNSIFLLFDSRYYPASNAAQTSSDNIYLGGLTFPLTKSRTLAEEEATYLRRNSKAILEQVAHIEAQVEKGEGMEGLISQLNSAFDVNFFLNHIAREDNPLLKITPYQLRELSKLENGKSSLENIHIMPQVINENVVAINSRLYPLLNIDKPSTVFFGGNYYTLGKSKLTLDQAEKQYQASLAQELKLRAIARSSKCLEIHQGIENLIGENNHLIKDLKIKVNPYSYESGNEGFDTSIQRVYVLIDAHSNHTTGKSYAFGQTAATMPISHGELGTEARFAERLDCNSPFVVNNGSHCFGDLKLHGTSLEDKIFYLREVATTIGTQGGFYQLPTTSSDSSDNN
jgi:hypothetical protein